MLEAHSLIVFGGGAPVHACQLADKLGLDTVIVPTDAGVGSALGFLRAPVSYEVCQDFPAPRPFSPLPNSERSPRNIRRLPSGPNKVACSPPLSSW